MQQALVACLHMSCCALCASGCRVPFRPAGPPLHPSLLCVLLRRRALAAIMDHMIQGAIGTVGQWLLPGNLVVLVISIGYEIVTRSRHTHTPTHQARTPGWDGTAMTWHVMRCHAMRWHVMTCDAIPTPLDCSCSTCTTMVKRWVR